MSTISSTQWGAECIVEVVTHNDQTTIPVTGTEFQEGDVMYLAVIPSAMIRLEELLGLERI